MIPTSIDGTDITGATIDGTDVQEITVDGDTVFTAAPDIPASQDLHARYSAKSLSLSDGNPVSTWTDETGNGHDLTAGTAPTYVANGINGNPVVRFDGVDDYLNVAFSTLSQPTHVFIVFQAFSGTTIYDSFDSLGGAVFNRHYFQLADRGSGVNWEIFNGNVLNSGTAGDTSAHIAGNLHNSTSSTMRLDGSQIASGNPGTEDLNGLTVGARGESPPANHAEVDVGEILLYPVDKSSIQSDVESYLSSEWGIAV